MLSALVDMGADGDDIISHMTECAKFLPGSAIKSMSFQKESRNGIVCTKMSLETRDPPSRPAHQIIEAVEKSASYMNLSEAAAKFASLSVSALVDAESRIHGTKRCDTHLHEAASLDTLVDISGVALALDCLGISNDRTIIMPVNVGSGSVEFSHGTFPNPAPATLEILRASKIPVAGSMAGRETATPTGACILAGLRGDTSYHYPLMTPTLTGYGAGARDAPDFANVLRLVVGEPEESWANDSINVLETNIDDATGEMLGAAISAVIKQGALDASMHTGVGKKGRPATVMSVLCRPSDTNAIIHTMIRYTGTLGVRVTHAQRHTIDRYDRTASIHIGDRCYTIRYKTRVHQDIQNFKIEFDDIMQVSQDTGMSITHAERVLQRGIEDAQ